MTPSVQAFIDIVGKHPEEMEKGDTILTSEIALRLLMAIEELQKERDALRQDLKTIADNTEDPGTSAHQWKWLIAVVHQWAKASISEEAK